MVSSSFKAAGKGELPSTNDTSKTDYKLHFLLITVVINLSGFVCQAPKVLTILFYFPIIWIIAERSGHSRGQVPATGPCNKSRGQVPPCELAMFASKSNSRDQLQLWSLRLVEQIQTSLKFWDKSLRLVPQNASCELFVGQVSATSPFV